MILPAWLSGFNLDGTAYTPTGPWLLYASHIVTDGDPYMSRWIGHTPWFEVRLHHIHREDRADDPHDHPFDFTTRILRGGYREILPLFSSSGRIVGFGTLNGGPAMIMERRPGDAIRHRATDYHKIVSVKPDTWTLVITGPKLRSWGFHTPTGWVHWRKHVSFNGCKQ